MMVAKIPDEKRQKIRELAKKGWQKKDIAQELEIDRSTVHRYTRDLYKPNTIPREIQQEVIKKYQTRGYSRADIALMHGVSMATVARIIRGIPGYPCGHHLIRKPGIELLNRLMIDGYLISDFNVPTVRNLQKNFPVIKTARYKDKTFFYLPGREEETIEAFFREKPDRVISYSAIEEMSYLLGVKVSNKNQRKLLERYRKKHDDYWRSRRLIQRSIDDWIDDSIPSESSFRLFPR